MKINHRFALFAAALFLFFGATGCEISDPLEDVELIVDVQDAEVNLGGGGVGVPVQAGETAATTTSVGNELDVDAVQLETINLKPSFFSFSETAKSGAVMDTGTLTLVVSIGSPPNGPLFPLSPITITITDDVVTNVQPSSISLAGGTYDVAAIQELLNSLPADQRPNMTPLGGLTLNETKGAIEAALANETGFLFSIIAKSEGVSGSITLDRLSMDARVSQGTN